MGDQNLVEIILHASPVVQAVIVLLLLMSLIAWTVAFAKSAQIRKTAKQAQQFQNRFDTTEDLTQLYNELSDVSYGLPKLFEAGYQEFVRLKKQGVSDINDLVSGTQRAMKVAFSKESERLETQLPTLATIGSSAPYIGLFGTVWGVMHAFQSLGNIQHATLAAVAPGIAEALVATAVGLFAAIPAVIFYNSLSSKADKVLANYETFAEGFLTIIQRQAHLLSKSEQSS
jgi:biopolymer transport protein TolQ